MANKYRYLFVLQGLYGNSWDDLTQSENYREMKIDLKCYQDNEKGQYRIIQRRELNV